jgi:molybdate transport system substrate-binding protein
MEKRQLDTVAVYALLLVLLSGSVLADSLRIAVASNFSTVIDEIVAGFEEDSGHALSISLGSTGKHYAQIVNGAPFDLFLAADTERPQRLEREGRTVPGSRFTYAIGQLVVWAPRRETLDLPGALADRHVGRIAIANPRLAPYGRAAKETLEALGLWQVTAPNLVRGENIGQAFQFVFSGNADIGLVALSQLVAHADAMGGARWQVPIDLHAPIAQQAVMLRDTQAGQAFMHYLRSPAAQNMIRDAGYRLP